MHCYKCKSFASLLHKVNSHFSFNRSCSLARKVEEVCSHDVEHGFKFCNSEPTEHSLKFLSQIYSMPKRIATGVLSDAIPKHFREVSQCIDDYGILLRKPSLQIIDDLNKNNGDAKKFVLYGHDGNGKSMSLLHVMHYCLQNDWLIVYVPNGFKFIDGQNRSVIQPSTWNTTRFDQPIEATIWLNSFSKINSKFLQQLKTTQTYKWGKKEVTEEGKPLNEIVTQTAGRNVYSTDAIGILLKEIKKQNQVKVLYAINGFNAFFGKTSHKHGGKLVEVGNLGLVYHFTKLLETKDELNNCAYVMNLSQTSQFSQKRVEPQNLPKLLGEKGLDLVSSFKKLELEKYSDEEYKIIINYYRYKRWLIRDASDKLRQEIMFMSQMNPNLVAKLCAAL